ncbi:phosphoglycerate mutase-like protein AT74H [Tanacetum coccineum]
MSFTVSSFHTIKCCEDTIGRRQRVTMDETGLFCFPEKNLVLNPPTIKPPRPRRIILVRHGQSEGNVDEGAYTRVADPKIRLTEKGKREAEKCGEMIREMIEKDGADDWKVYFYVSPYRRTNETLRGLGKAFERSRIAGVREEPRLREQDFGFRETLRTDIDIGRFQPPGEQSPNMNLVIVSHGLTLRVFLMRWYKWTVEQFERLNNMPNANMMVMQTGAGGRYSLLVHHNEQQLTEFGLTQEMLDDQKWQSIAKPGELNYNFLTNGPSFFTHLDDEPKGRFS